MAKTDIFEIIRGRRSVRSFQKRPLSSEDAAAIEAFAAQADNPYALEIEWRLLSASRDRLSSPVITGADTYIAGKMNNAAHAEEAFGWSFERISLYAESLGIGSTCIAGTMDRCAFERAMDLKEGEVMPCVSPLGYPADRMSVRETLMRKAIKADERLPFSSLFFDGSFSSPLSEEKAGVLRLPLEAVRLAPSAVNGQPWRAVVCGDNIHFYEQRKKGKTAPAGWDIQKVDMGIAMCHFSLALASLGAGAQLYIEDPGIELPEYAEYTASFRVM